MRPSDIAIGICMAILAVLLSYLLVLGGLGPAAPELPPKTPRPLAIAFQNYTYTPWAVIYSALSPNAITAIVWDFRGLDTYFETAVLFISIVGLVALLRGAEIKLGISAKGLSVIVKTATRLIFPLILAAGASLAFHGHLTPGGGFQGGSFMTVAMVMLALAFSIEFLQQKRVSIGALLTIRVLGLLAIAIVAVCLLIEAVLIGGYAYIFQNMVRVNSSLSMPSQFIDKPLAGTIFFFNLSECVAVIGGLSLGAVLLLLREEEVKPLLGGEEHE
jgi:multicomponent Na+:H+ antiporter subunit B